MVTLRFTLTPEASARVHDVLACLAKFSESVSIEARRERLAFTALNTSKSAYASFSLDVARFFSSYEFVPDTASAEGRFTCRMLNKALLSVFRGRLVDVKGRDTAIERCEVSVQDQPDETECRVVVKMICHHGVTKTYRLVYEPVEVMHALFDKSVAKNRWRMRSTLLREFVEYFGPKTEQLDVYLDSGRVTFTSFTEKIQNNKQEILKQPLQTSISVNTTDFEEFNVEEKLHIIISVKDFRAIVTHAGTFETGLSAIYSQPSRPLQFSYSTDGLHCEFTLMTTGDYRGTPAPAPINTMPSKPPSTTRSTHSEYPGNGDRSPEMPPPAIPSSRTSARRLRQPGLAKPSPSAKSAEPDPESLFVPAEDEDRRWDPVEYRDDEDTLGWDASAENDVGFRPTFKDAGTVARSEPHESEEGLAPTQRVSQISGALW